MLPFVHFPVLSPLILLHSLVLGALFLPRTFAFPIPRTVTLESLLSFEDYNSFQISGGVGGNALEEAQSIFQDPFRDIDLVYVPYTVYERMLMMWEAVEYASIVGYPEAIESARNKANATLVESLLVGEKKNTVLMRMAQVQILRIKVAKDESQGTETDESEEVLNEFEEELTEAAEEDRRNGGRVSSSIPFYYPL